MSSQFNAKGYHYPVVINDNCINCLACYSICPEFAIFATPAPSHAKTREPALSIG